MKKYPKAWINEIESEKNFNEKLRKELKSKDKNISDYKIGCHFKNVLLKLHSS